MLFGTNNGAFAQMTQAGIPLFSERSYNSPSVNVPASFPGPKAAVPPSPIVPIVSFKPSPTAVLTGQLDPALTTYLAAAPAGSFICAWHEGNEPHSSFPGTPTEFVAMHAYIASLARQVNPGVKVCAIYGTYPVHAQGQDLTEWVCPGLSAYLLDGYQINATDTPDVVFGQAAEDIHAVVPNVNLGIAETNSAINQAEWFPEAFGWAQENGAITFAPYFNAPGGGYPFNPADTATVDALKLIARQAAATP